MSDKDHYIGCRHACVERMLIVEAGFLSRAKVCLRELEKIGENERKADDYLRLSKNLFFAFTVADSMMNEIENYIRYYDEKIRESGEVAPSDETAENTNAEGEDGTV